MLSLRNKKLVLFVITMLCITTVVSAVTWKELYAALDAFLNAKGIWETVAGQIKSLEDQEKSLQDKLDAENSREQSYNSRILKYMGKETEYSQKVETRKKDIVSATAKENSTKSTMNSARTSYNFSVLYTKQAKREYDNFVRMCDDPRYCPPDCYYCNEQARLYKNWQDWKKESEKDKKAFDNATSEYGKAYELKKSLEKNLTWLESERDKYTGLIRYNKNSRDFYIEKSKKIKAEMKSVKEKLKERRDRRDELRKATPIVRVYMDNILKAWESPNFDFQKYIEENPPPQIIFDEE